MILSSDNNTWTAYSWILNVSKDGYSTASLGNLYQYLTSCKTKQNKAKESKAKQNKILCLIEFPVFEFLPIVSCSVSGYGWKESGLIFNPTHQIFTDIDGISLILLSSKMNSPVSLSLSF